MEKKGYCIILMIIPEIIACNFFPASYVFGESPSFSLQGINNSHHHWNLEKIGIFAQESANNITQCSTTGKHFPFPKIAAVNYISSGKTLNATLWLESPFRQPTASPVVLEQASLSSVDDKYNNSLDFSIKKHTITEGVRKYAFIIHVDSIYDIGQTYQVAIDWNNTINGHVWRRATTESAPASVQADPRVLQQENNYNLSFVPGENYINLSLNLDLLSYPSQYSIIAYASEEYKEDSVFCKLIDVTDVVHIPPPDFGISTSPGHVVLIAGENKTVGLQVKSNANLQSNISLSTDQNPNVKLTFEPNKLYISPFETKTSIVHVEALHNASSIPYTLPIKANISFPMAITNWLTGDILNNPGTAAIIKQANFTASVRPPPNLSEQLNDVWTAWGGPITGIVTLIVAVLGVVGGWSLKHFKSKKSKERFKEGHNKMGDGSSP